MLVYVIEKVKEKFAESKDKKKFKKAVEKIAEDYKSFASASRSKVGTIDEMTEKINESYIETTTVYTANGPIIKKFVHDVERTEVYTEILEYTSYEGVIKGEGQEELSGYYNFRTYPGTRRDKTAQLELGEQRKYIEVEVYDGVSLIKGNAEEFHEEVETKDDKKTSKYAQVVEIFESQIQAVAGKIQTQTEELQK